ncbi:MAG: PD-(D/E)XK nuclease family protein [Myxococcota bacterium]|nr:PD-(D/E)XK nuclease family protein [Myxococcota bacterium]
MTWWNELLERCVAEVREQPFASRSILAPTAFARRSLRVDLTQALAEQGLPLSGWQILAPQEFKRLFQFGQLLRAPRELQLALLQAFAQNSGLLGYRSPRAWRDQLRLAQALLSEDLEALEPETLNAGLAASPRLQRFAQLVRKVASEVDGREPLSAAEASPSPESLLLSLPLPRLPKRLEALYARLGVETLQGTPADQRFVQVAKTPQHLAEAAVEALQGRGSKRVALVLLDAALAGPIGRALDAAGIPWMGSQRRASGFDPDLRRLAEHPLARQAEIACTDSLAEQVKGLSERIDLAAKELVGYGDFHLSGGAFVDQIHALLERDLPRVGWSSGTVHVLPGSAWPDASYDEVQLVGAGRGKLASALGDHTPLLTPMDRQLLHVLGLVSFDLGSGSEIQKDWLAAWSQAAPTLSVSWLSRNASGRALVPDRWAKELARGCQTLPVTETAISQAVPAALDSQTLPPISFRSWSPSRIETVMRCPRQALLKRFLKLEANEPSEGLESLSSPKWNGIALHTIIDRAMKRVLKGDSDFKQISGLLEAEVERFLAEITPPLPSGLMSPLQRSFMGRFQALIERVEDGTFSAVLASEKGLTDDPGNQLTSVKPGVYAKCDLVLRDAQGRKLLVDIKSSAAKDSGSLKTSERSGKSVQRGIYLSLVADAAASAMLYLGGGTEPLQLAQQDGEEKQVALEVLRRAQTHVDRGAFPPEPDQKFGPCEYCDVRSACRPFDSEWVHALQQHTPKFEDSVLKMARAAAEKEQS